jgi:phage terminase small subunit
LAELSDDELQIEVEQSGLALPLKQQKFCLEYLKDGNAGKSCVRAGYGVRDSRSRGCTLLKYPRVVRYLSALREQIRRELRIDIDRILKEIAAIAFCNISDVVTFTQEGLVVKDSSSLPQNVSSAISEVQYYETSTGGGEETSRITVKMSHGKVGALTLLAKHFGVIGDFGEALSTLREYGVILFATPDGEWVLARGGTGSKEIRKSSDTQ